MYCVNGYNPMDDDDYIEPEDDREPEDEPEPDDAWYDYVADEAAWSNVDTYFEYR